MRLPSIPGPGDVLSAVEGVREGIADALALVPRLGAVVGRVEELVDRVAALMDRVEGVVDRADAAITAVEATHSRVDVAIDRVAEIQRKADDAITAVGATQAKADQAITAVGRTTQRADDALARAEGLVARMAPLADEYAEPLQMLAPSVRRLAETFDPHEVEALVTLIDRLPVLVGHLDEDILPVLASMDNVAPDLHALLDTVQDLREVVKGFPGSRLFRRRGREEIAQGEDGTAAEP